jgi:membrane-associated phospholipid phosphatase
VAGLDDCRRLGALIVALLFILRGRRWRPLALLAAAVAGALGFSGIVNPVVGRPRPPSAIWIGHYAGASFPSANATLSIAFYSMLAIVLGAGRSLRAKTVVWSTAALVVMGVGAASIYLGAHWMTDVLGAYALGASWVAVVVIAMLVSSSRGRGTDAATTPRP